MIRLRLSLLISILLPLAGGFSFSAWGAESAPSFDLPVSCTLGESCWIQNHVDHDPGPNAIDYHQGSLTYDGHRGTDFRVKTFREMRAGVPVIAAADGKVKAVRDGMADGPASGTIDKSAIGERLSGNGVVIDHGQGWESQYGHLRQGSVIVKPGQKVRAGERLGWIGQSGMAQFPHVHFEIRRNGQFVDPFSPPDPEKKSASPLWSSQAWEHLKAYRASGELSSGFSDTPPDIAWVADPPDLTLDASAKALIFWVNIFGARTDDRENMRLIAPSGTVLAKQSRTYTKNQARSMRFLGKPRPKDRDSWPSGRYTGEYTLEREGASAAPLVRIIRTLDIP
ncbi:MAG: M23 family metallopeptidase [Magnetococcales bacterium]|nr:M23 family metallopeptidase [Magnetococcales bacterium]